MALVLISGKSYIISISFSSGCYRHIKISQSDTLYDLHTAILKAFKIEDNQAHAFFLDNGLWSDANSYFDGYFMGIFRRTIDYALDKVLSVCLKFKYLFDFSDNLVFQCKVLRETDAICSECTVIKSKGDHPFKHLNDNITAKQTTNNILTYFDAFADLYGIISLDRAFEIYNSQNETVSREEFAEITETAKDMDKHYIINNNNEIVNLDVVNDCLSAGHDAYTRLKKLQSEKPYYIPEKENLLKQADDTYCERDIYFYALADFLKTETNLSENETEDVADEILFLCSRDENIDKIISCLYRMGVQLKNIQSEGPLYNAIITLKNNTRLWSNRGYTTVELNKLKLSIERI
ncbi:MAG: IS1096 element passenger TnpR family protein [Eubacteriales bacterium]